MALALKSQPSPLSNAGKIIAYYERVGEHVGFALAHLERLTPASGALTEAAFISVRNSVQYIGAEVGNLCGQLAELEEAATVTDFDREALYERINVVNSEGKLALNNLRMLVENDAITGDYTVQISALACIMQCFAGHSEVAKSIIAYYFASASGRRKHNLAVVIDATKAFGKPRTAEIEPPLPQLHRKQEDEGILKDSDKKPVHPGVILDNYLRDNEISVMKAAELLEVSRVNIYRLMAGDINLSPAMAKALARNKIGGSALDWLILQAKFDLAQPDRPPASKRRAAQTPKR